MEPVPSRRRLIGLVRALVAIMAVAGGALAQADLAGSYQRGDLAALRHAGAGGREDLGRALTSPDRATVLGALIAAEAAPTPWELLTPLAAVAGGWDRSTAAPAARTASRIARLLDGDAAILHDAPDERLAAAGEAWQALAARADRWSDVRVHALEVTTRIARARAATAEVAPDDSAALLAVARGDDDAQVRRAAIELLPVPVAVVDRAALVERLSADAEPTVRVVAAQALCAAIPEDAAAVLAVLGDAGLERLRAVLAAPPAGVDGALLDAARCLAADPDPRSLRALVALRHGAPRSLRASVARVAADVRARLPEASP